MMTVLIPMAVMVFYIWGMAVYTFIVRSRAVASKSVSVRYYKTFDVSEGAPPEYVLRVGRHYNNLMELPFLYLITCALCLFYGLDNGLTISLSWLFILSRIMHTFIHLGSNHILRRASAFALGWLVIVSFWVLLLLHYFGSINKQ